MARPRNESLQERRLEQAQRALDRINRQQERARKLVELEMQRLAQMREGQSPLLQGKPDVLPELYSSAPAAFDSQYDQFKNTLSGERLSSDPANILRADALPVKSPTENVGAHSFADNNQHWTELNTSPHFPVYVSGYYFSSGPDTKRYEYMVWPDAYPIKVGDMVSAPVHPVGYHQGRHPGPGHDRRFIIEDIYAKERFHPYHDLIR